MQKKWRALIAGLTALVGVSAASGVATAAVTFCGDVCLGNTTIGGIKYSNDTSSVSYALGQVAQNGNCTWCHERSSGSAYIKSAFEFEVLADWVKGSYWAGEDEVSNPGKTFTKAYSAWKRIYNFTMPPGLSPANVNSSDPNYDTGIPYYFNLRTAIGNWMTAWAACSNNFNSSCVWGTNATSGAYGTYTTTCGRIPNINECNYASPK